MGEREQLRIEQIVHLYRILLSGGRVAAVYQDQNAYIVLMEYFGWRTARLTPPGEFDVI